MDPYREGQRGTEPPHPSEEDRGGAGRWVCRQCNLYSFDSYYDMIRHEQTDCQAAPRYYPSATSRGEDTAYAEAYSHGTAGHGVPPRSTAVAATSRDYRAMPSSRIRQQHAQLPLTGTAPPRGAEYSRHAYYDPQQRSQPSPPLPVQESSPVTPLRRRVQIQQQVHESGGSGSSSSRSVSFSPSTGHPLPPGGSHNPTSRSATSATDIAQHPQQLSSLLTIDEMSSLSEQDRMLCQSIMAFTSRQQQVHSAATSSRGEAAVARRGGPSYAEAEELAPAEEPERKAGPSASPFAAQQGFRPATPVIRIVGFQCAYCLSSAGAAQDLDPFTRVFPGSVETIGSSLYLMKERHFRGDGIARQKGAPSSEGGGCPYAPEHVLRILQSSKAISSEQRYHETMALQSACEHLAQRVGIVNNHPYKTGIILGAVGTTKQYYPEGGVEPEARAMQQQQQQQYYGMYESPLREDEYRGSMPTYSYGSGDRYRPSTRDRHGVPTHRGASAYGPGYVPESGRQLPSPFIYDGYGWTCPHCSNIPYHLRAPGSFNRDPPSTEFTERHYAVCTGLSSPTASRSYDQSRMPPYAPGYPPPYAPPSYSPYPSSGPPGWRMGPPPEPYYPSPYGRPEYGYHAYPPSHDPRAGASGYYYPAEREEPSPPVQARPTDASFQAAIELLSSLEEVATGEEPLVLPEDKLLLTDYFYYVNKQLKVCRFTESDRKTRGGKRETIEVGFGGLECRHCAGSSGSRKFFWSDVDRLANSFAEIPGHILKCRKCPENVKQALLDLKQRHPEQMARLPRGSQKVFFRRMWKRLHNHPVSDVKQESQGALGEVQDTTLTSVERETPSVVQDLGVTSEFQRSRSEDVASRVISSQVLLSIPEDEKWLSDFDCFIRRKIEVFCATEDQVELNRTQGKSPIQVGQVGIRCFNCSLDPKEGAEEAVLFPRSMELIHEAVRELLELHFDRCPSLSQVEKQTYFQLRADTAISTVSRKYYVEAAKTLGMYDTSYGVTSKGGPLHSNPRLPLNTTDLDVLQRSRKRASSPDEEGEREAKKPSIKR